MDTEFFSRPIKDDTWTVACSGGRCSGSKCCIEAAQLEGGGFALRNTRKPDTVIRCSVEELREFQSLIPGLLNGA